MTAHPCRSLLTRHPQCWLPLLATLCMAVTIGCGTDRPDTVKASGTVTFDGGKPPAGGMIFFAPITVAEGFPRRPGRATFDTDGTFTVTSFSDGDGLVPGTYRVSVECWQTPPDAAGTPGISYVADDFSPENVSIPVDEGRQTIDLDVPKKAS